MLEAPLAFLLLLSSLVWNGFSNIKITPELFLIVFLSINFFIITAYFIYYPTQHKKIRICRTKIGIYQETWPTIIDVITDADGENYLPEEPERLNFVELSSVEYLPIKDETKAINEDIDEMTTLVFRPLIEEKHEKEPKKKQPEEKIYTIEELCAQYGIEAY